MVYPHQQKAIDYITKKLGSDPDVLALLISGSIAHGFNNEHSDVDLNIVVSDELFEQKRANNMLMHWESAADFYEGGYFDGKIISPRFLSLVAERGNEPTRFALHDARIAFDRTGKIQCLLEEIGKYPSENDHAVRFLSQLEAWKWYTEEALTKRDPYLLDLAVSRLVLFAGRLILLENKMFFPYHKWFMKVLESAPNKPKGMMQCLRDMLRDKTEESIVQFYELIRNHKDWAEGIEYRWPEYFLRDVEIVWMRHDDFIENI